jgi:trigger factor
VAAKEAYAAVNEPDVTDNEVYVPDSEPDAPDNEVYVPDSEPDAATSEPDAATSEPFVADSEPDAPDSEPDAPDNEVYVPTSEPDAPTSEPYVPTSEPYVPSANFHFSDGFDDNGYLKDVRALDLVELFDISAILIPASVHTIDPAKIESAIISYLKDTAPFERIPDRPLADGDIFNYDYVVTIDGVEIERGSHTLNLNKAWFSDDGVLEQMLGHTPGETYDIITVCSEKEASKMGSQLYSGKDIVSTETLNYICQPIEPELTDAYIAENYSASDNWNSVAEMWAEFEEDLKTNSIYNYIFDDLIANTPVSSVPAAITQYMTDRSVTVYNLQALACELSLQDFLVLQYNTVWLEEALKKTADSRTQATKDSLVMQAIAEKTGMVVTSEELQTFYHDNYDDGSYEKYVRTEGEPFMKHHLLERKVTDYIYEHLVYE